MSLPPFHVRRLTGSLKGTTEAHAESEMSLGTGPGSTVRFDPTWDKGVASRHARVFRDDHGQVWVEDAGSGTGTFINGKRVTTKLKLAGATVIELGHGGPKVEVIVAGGPAIQPPSLGPASKPHNSSNALKIVLMLLVLGIASVWFWQTLGKTGLGGLVGSSDEKLQAVVKRHESSVGLVICAKAGQSQPTGTAWVVRPGVFATNAHVVVPVIKTLREGGTAYVVPSKTSDSRLRVTQAIAHPRYFDAPVSVDGKGQVTSSYDVGLLVVEGETPSPMVLAQEPKLRQLDSGHRIAFLGFPMENLRGNGVDLHHPVATMQSGIVTAVTDFWLARADYQARTLVQHNLPAVGGASGSPIFDAEGQVVAILSSGNITFTMSADTWLRYSQAIAEAKDEAVKEAKKKATDPGAANQTEIDRIVAELEATVNALDRIPVPVMDLQRAPSAAQINFAQRIDLLQDLLSAFDEAKKEGKL